MNANGYDLIAGVPVKNKCTCTWSSELGWSARHCDMHRKPAPPPLVSSPIAALAAKPKRIKAKKWGTT